MATSPIEHLTKDLTPAEMGQLNHIVQVFQALSEQQGDSQSKIGGLSLIQAASPAVQNVISTLLQAIDTPRNAPFEQKYSEQDHLENLFEDPKAAGTIKQALDSEMTTVGLLRRMGGQQPKSTSNDTSGRRAALSKAYDDLLPQSNGEL